MKKLIMEREEISAFPSKEIDHNESSTQGRTVYHDQEKGMTLRDYFAAKSISNHPKNGYDAVGLARYAYEIADAMLKEREL